MPAPLPRLLRLLGWSLAGITVLAAFAWLTRDFWFRQARIYVIGSGYVAAEDATVNLPGIDRIEVSLIGATPGPSDEYFYREANLYAVRQRVLCDAVQAQRLVALWRRLPCVYGRSFLYLCHDPVYGLRFWRGKQQLLETTVCWKCGNFLLPMWGGRSPYPFDARHKASQELLAELRSILPEEAVSATGNQAAIAPD